MFIRILPKWRAQLIFYAGIEHVGGDMFHNIPKGDAIVMKVEFGYCVFKVDDDKEFLGKFFQK